MRTKKSVIVEGSVIPAGTELNFGAGCECVHEGKLLKLEQIPLDAIAIEAVLSTKGALAIDTIIAVLQTVMRACPPEDRARLRKVLNAAYKAVNSTKPIKEFNKLLGLQ